jgi:hypothetical protein
MRTRIFLISTMVFLLGFFQAKADEISQAVDFSTADLVLSTSQGFDVIYLKGCDNTDQVGEPQLPVKLFHVALPPGSKIEQVVVTKTESQTLPDEYHIFPAQPPQILSLADKPISFVQPKPKVYSLMEEYPGKLVEYTETGFMGGYQLAGILVYPVQYIPSQKKIKFCSHIEFKVRYSFGGKFPLPVVKRSNVRETLYERIVKRAVLNPEGVSLHLRAEKISSSLLPPGDYEYVIITDTTFVSTFQTLADWKTKKGVPAKIVTTNWIYSHYSGYDNAEKVRNFIQDAYQNWGTIWVLLGGDTSIVPARIAWAMDCEAGYYPDENDIRCDLYFSDLDGTWDANGNHIYGEVADSIDMYPDVFVGRASCSTVAKAQALVNKLLTYEKSPPTDYQTKMLFCAEVLWSDPYTNSGLAKDLVDERYVPPQFDPITKLYEALGNESRSSVIAAMNEGQNVINHDGHANYTVMGVGTGYLSNSDMDALHNGPRNSILFSIGCWPAAFDYDCIAEHFINNTNGGGVAFIGNSRYGWGSPGNPEYGYSDRFDQQFFAALFTKDVYHIGATLADMKAFYSPRAGQENVYRWCEYEINLLGEPEMAVWTNLPQYLSLEFSDTIPQGPSLFTVTVSKADGTPEPVPGALVCVMKGEEVYQRGLTDSQGQIDFDVSPLSAGQLYVTVTAHNFMPYQDSAWVIGEGPYVLYLSHQIEDSEGGNQDGLVNPGETVNMPLTLKNYGNDIAYNVSAVLHPTSDPYVTLIDSSQNFGTINPGGIATSLEAYDFSVNSNCPNGHVIYFNLEINDESGNSWRSMIAITVVTPGLSYRSYWVNDESGGNGNGIPEPGETFDLNVLVKNEGAETASQVMGLLSTSNPHVYINDNTASFSDIPSNEVRFGTFEVFLFSNSPATNFPCFGLQTSTDDGYVFQDSFILTVGEPGFEDDMESGTSEWTHGGTGDLWHLSTHRPHSGDWSWYNGIEGSWYFNNSMNCWLRSSSFILGPNSYLSFWLWYDVTNYGVDGIYVEIVNALSGVADTLDYIGTGGDLDTVLNIGNDWLKYSYDLSFLPPGTTIRVRFSFISDAQYTHDGEGFYIDDVRVGPTISTLPGDVTSDGKVDVADVVFLINYLFVGGPAPNPMELGDVNCDGLLDITDVVYLVNYLYVGGPPPQECE